MVSPQNAEASRKFAQDRKLTMDLLIDSANRVAKEYGLVYTVPDDLQKVYKQLGIDLAKQNDDGSWELPMPARYIIDRDKKIRYAEVNPDYTVRPDPSHTIEALKNI